MNSASQLIPDSFNEKCTVAVEQPVIWGDMDAYQHVNNTIYFRYFEDIRMAYFRHVGVEQHMAEFNQGPILAHTECSFRLPLTYPGRVWVGAKATILSEKKINMEYLVYSDSHRAIAAEGSGLIVFYDYSNNKSCAIPQVVAQKIEIADKANCEVLK